ncbi:DUF4157 domain-containing protein [Nocardia sp. XZ_19_231]|uniref:eCIS core domain-containing protein n=1 Tax=Nocardia sp. XZ_19_231 TaxID=2769252 RepID=UPI001E315DD8|nr:DUF4157 domain-containing protein [Nocardia sp. XZ_19_231]
MLIDRAPLQRPEQPNHRQAGQDRAPRRVPPLVGELSTRAPGRSLSQVPTFAGQPWRPHGEQLVAPPGVVPGSGVRDPAEVQADRLGSRIAEALVAVPLAAGPISPRVRRAVEPVLGTGLAGVEFDDGPAAQVCAARKRALGITEGTHIWFAAKAFVPTTPAGRALIGHELTHVAQQRTHGVCVAQKFGVVVDYEKLAGEIHTAIEGIGTDEEAIYRALNSLRRDPESIRELESAYQRRYQQKLLEALEGDLDSDELDYAKGLLGEPVAPISAQAIPTGPIMSVIGWDALARRLKAAVEYRTLGTDEEAIFAVLEPLSGNPDKVASIKDAFARAMGNSDPATLEMRLGDEMSGSELAHALELLWVPDPHAGTPAELSGKQLLAVRNELLPGTAVEPLAEATKSLPQQTLWDGRDDPENWGDWEASRDVLRTKLLAALTDHLAQVKGEMDEHAKSLKLPIHTLEGAASAAVEVTDDEYKSWYAVSAAPPGQAALRSGFEFSSAAGNLIDANDPAVRAAAGAAIGAEGRALWIIEHGAGDHMKAHSFNPRRPGYGEPGWLEDTVIEPFLAVPGRRAEVERYDLFGFALALETGTIAVPTTVPGGRLGAGGSIPNLPDRQAMWMTWHVGVHEYLHTLAHPTFRAAYIGPVMEEGFTEYFTKAVLLKAAPVAHQNTGLVKKVEGGIFAPPTTREVVGDYKTPESYLESLRHVEKIARTMSGGGNSVRAAYFQGHVEMLGIDPTTNDFVGAPPATVETSLVTVPAGIATAADLASRTGIPESEIRAANPGLGPVGLPRRVTLPGLREHVVVATVTSVDAASTERVEGIAAQNGISVAALKRANPAIDWASLRAGQRLLIPRQ